MYIITVVSRVVTGTDNQYKTRDNTWDPDNKNRTMAATLSQIILSSA